MISRLSGFDWAATNKRMEKQQGVGDNFARMIDHQASRISRTLVQTMPLT